MGGGGVPPSLPLPPASDPQPEPPRALGEDDRLTPAENGGDTCWLSGAWHLYRLAGLHEGTGLCGAVGTGQRECAGGRCGLDPLGDFIRNGSDWKSPHRSYLGLMDVPGLMDRERKWLSREVRAGDPQSGLLALASLSQRHARHAGDWVRRHCWRGLTDRVVRLCDNRTITLPLAQTEPDIAPRAILALEVSLQDTNGVKRRTLAECVERTFRPWEGDAEFHQHLKPRDDGDRDKTHNCSTITYRESRERAAPERAFIQLTRSKGFEAQAPFIPDDVE